MSRLLIIGSRGSDLALWQSNFVLAELKKAGIAAEIRIIKTKGDDIQSMSFDKMEGKGFFTKEIEDALLNKEIDIAVHSHKDLPTENPDELIVAAVSYRENPSDVLIIRKEFYDPKQKFSLKAGATVGTSSARRKSQFISFRDDVKVADLRGNVPTRVQKLKDGKYDAILLAKAGIDRLQLNLEDLHAEVLDPHIFNPAPAQGALAIQIRKADKELAALLQKIHHPDVQTCIAVERKILNLFEGGCQLPLGAYCEEDKNEDDEIFYRVWVSRAKTWNSFPVSLYYETQKPEEVPEIIVNKINDLKPASIFITRDERKNDYLRKGLSALGFDVKGRALIDFKAIPLRSFPVTDWIFFSSKHAVKNFLIQKPALGEVKFGVVGKGTADELRRFGKKAEFIGYSVDTKLTGKQFAAVVGSKTVLFPQAKESLRTIQQQFTKKDQVYDLPVYETVENLEGEIPDTEILLFTSPSNVEGFLKKKRVSKTQRIVAMGDATAAALKKAGLKTDSMPASFDDIGLLRAILMIA
jgi:hydroxymethylbilane synthase